MQNNIILQNLITKIESGEQISPVLFISPNLELLHIQIESIINSLLVHFQVPNQAVFRLKDDSQIIKIEDMKSFISHSFKTTSFKFQIFFIENISRLNDKSANSSLKFLEEPGLKNIIFMSNSFESQVMETILSRVSTVKMDLNLEYSKNDMFYELLEKHKKLELYSYFFSSKLEKAQYLDFLQTLLIYGKTHFNSSFLQELAEDIFAIQKNNTLAKYIVDKWILKIK